MSKTDALVKHVKSNFSRLADPEKAPAMAAYMKTDMPFYGIQKPDRIAIYKEIKKQYAPESQKDYEDCVLALWNLPHREEKYAALDYAGQFKPYITSKSLKLYEHLIRDGAWWDFVDPLATILVGDVLLKEREQTQTLMNKWTDDDDMWIRRSAILSQNHHKKNTNQQQLFDHCLKLCHEKEFFIRKAIGWALREYSYADPKAVKKFLQSNRKVLSPLSYREGAKQLIRAGAMAAD